jgi:phage protein D
MTPAYRIIAEGKDVTANFNGRLIDLAIVDDSGSRAADTLSIVVEDSGSMIEVPASGAQLRVAIGYAGALTEMGVFVVDEVSIEGPPDRITIRAAGAPLIKSELFAPLHTQKSRSWPTPSTLGVLVAVIAYESGLTAELSNTVKEIQLPHIDQTNESDINLLTRIAAERGLIVKPTFGKIVVLSIDEAKTAKGRDIPRFAIDKSSVSTWSFRSSNRRRFQSVVTSWHNQATGQPVEVGVGSGDPVYRSTVTYANAQTAQAAASSFLRNFRRTGTEFTLTMPGQPTFIAEGRATLSGFRNEMNDGEWKFTRVEHRISRQGYNTVVTGTAVKEELPQPAQAAG